MAKNIARRQWMFRIAAICLAQLLALGGAEVVLQILDLPEQVYCGWRSTDDPADNNQLSFRGRRIAYDDDDFVIILVGDSQAAGYELPFEKMPERLLESSLHQLGHARIRVFSLACGAYGTDQQLLALEEYYRDHGYRADLIVLWQTPYNDVWNNMFVNQWALHSPPKPTFALVDGRLTAPTASRIGAPMLSPIKVVALIQKRIDQRYRLAANDPLWTQRYLPEPYKPIQWNGPTMDLWQKMDEEQFGYMPLENFVQDKCHYSLGFIPTSARTGYGLELTNALLHRMKQLVEANRGRFAAFEVSMMTSRLWMQPYHLEPRVYLFRNQKYRFSFAQEQANVRRMNEGIAFLKINCDVPDWRLHPEDWHLNEQAVKNVMHNLALRLVERGHIPPRPGRR